ncbi:amidohydrolase family protein [Nonomuraea fuscirosea]|uniref:N-acetylglucosamine-6-phosphate deacetylase n=1 Tax=Nonomuraea fuscirosea TaxID=1291556 RepID=UPI002DD8529D|nr:amidohydrolase family protein [Nonomuraea fuscirosea]WSA55757.1 amidohydrolase family protein [Nonomuraea fuscirosea]
MSIEGERSVSVEGRLTNGRPVHVEGGLADEPPVHVEGRLADGRCVRVELDGSRIAAVSDLTDVGGTSDALILPGLVDLQVNGYGGLDFNAPDLSPGDVSDLVRELWRRGTTTLCPTIITAPEAAIVRNLRVIAAAREADPLVRHAIPAVHVEGPYLAAEDGPRGAHDARHLRDPDLAEFARWQEAAGGLVRIVTLAPERPGAAGYIAGLARQGVIASIGHTAATPADIEAAVRAGARLSTHLGNGAHTMIRRHPNHLWAQLAEDRLAATFIADGHHLPADTFTVMLRAKGVGRSLLVSDSVAMAGRAPGDYTTPVGGRVTVRRDGRVTLPGGELLAGSGSSLLECLAWAVTRTEVDLGTAVRLAAANPSRLLGLDRGRVEPGAPADLIVTTPDLSSVLHTFVNGVPVHPS